jgi:hypothetical protein
MRHSTGELADGFHLLRLPELCFERSLPGDVGRDVEQPRRTAGLVVERVPDIPEPGDAAIIGRHAEFDGEAATLRNRVADRPLQRVGIGRVHHGEAVIE